MFLDSFAVNGFADNLARDLSVSSLKRRNDITVSSEAKGFDKILSGAIGHVNDLSINADKLALKMIVEPGSVNVHDVTHAMSKAEMAVSMTKAITDRVINAYRDLTNLR